MPLLHASLRFRWVSLHGPFLIYLLISTCPQKIVITKWADGWIKNNWRRSDGAPVMNRDIIEPLIAKIKNRTGPIKWVHVRAHIGTFGNEMADRLANAGAILPKPSLL
ncbi:ribonuclease H-like domain-containing protein [Gamsiella multidivaricata]|uniref:ribonuclease H-like domain-containing protein n=1 Tax=Gamsiella multidivaricata TaxID=101098 RepID=UPI00221FA9AB|nr:ribonuclease H-like domain-containing protein [Gamsiella multidivaricata]KAI7832263.1 ribonuclease H-like domain-containing protein [Gamsiella multidivaricata]